ncbi:MAG: hypothetical protein ACYTG3_21315 [Planctomycetota bacterium]|jgi:hypothetical protein
MNHLGKAFLALCLLWATVAAQQPLEVAGMPAEAPLTLWASASPEALTLDVRMTPGWHLYATDVGGGRPVAVTMERRSDFVARGALVVPAGKEGKLLGAFRLVLPLKKKGRGSAIACRFDFMACDPLRCLTPMSVNITGELRRLKVLLVVDREDARSKRISDFLQGSWMSPKITTYAKVTARACNAHDVVLADSKLFRKNEAGSVGRARGFPKTEAPIVAVGFLGTELIEGQGIAMTSGYI